MMLTDVEASLTEKGWAVVTLPDPAPVQEARSRLLEWIRANAAPDLRRLDDYHHAVVDDDRHVAILRALAQYFWDSELARPIIARHSDLFHHVLGPDLHVQRRPYLRAVRPSRSSDASPMHRDTYYGASPYELSVVVPFTDMDERAALRVVSGSHLASDAEFPFLQTASPDVQFRSAKHELGYAYAPRLLAPDLRDKAEPVPLKVGQVLMFGLSLVHGGGENHSERSRFSTDIRLVNSLAPVSFARGVDPEYFIPFSASPISRAARIYQQSNRAAEGK